MVTGSPGRRFHDPGTGFSFDFLPHAAVSNPENSPTHHVEIRAEAGYVRALLEPLLS